MRGACYVGLELHVRVQRVPAVLLLRMLSHDGGRARAEVGTDVVSGGSGYGPEQYDFVVELVGEEIPPACRGDGHYWLVYDVQAADE